VADIVGLWDGILIGSCLVCKPRGSPSPLGSWRELSEQANQRAWRRRAGQRSVINIGQSSPLPSLHLRTLTIPSTVIPRTSEVNSVRNKFIQGIFYFVTVKRVRRVNQIEDAFRCRATASGPRAHDRQLREHRYSTACRFTASSCPNNFLQACTFVVLTETETSTSNDHRWWGGASWRRVCIMWLLRMWM